MKVLKYCSFALISMILLASCVSKKKFNQAQMDLEECQENLNDCEEAKAELQSQLESTKEQMMTAKEERQDAEEQAETLRKQLEHLKETNTNLLDRLSDLSVISKSGAENLKKSLEALNQKNKYVKELTSAMKVKDSLNLALVTSLKKSLDDVDDEDVQINVKKGVVYISLSDKMLYRSGSAVISSEAKSVLSKISKILKDQDQLDIMVEGHTDNVPINTDCIKDNWDLSVHRATAVVRMLQKEFNVDPSRMTAAGRSEYVPKASNKTAEGRSLNRRTEIILLPKLDEFFSLLERATTGQ